jgi:hypothetical protein
MGWMEQNRKEIKMHLLTRTSLGILLLLFAAACSSTAGAAITTSPSPSATLTSKGLPPPNPGPATDVPAIVWDRTGGVAGICQQLSIFRNGHFVLLDCKTGMVIREGQLTSEQLDPFTQVLDQYRKFTWEVTLPTDATDMFMDKYSFLGTGSAVAAADTQTEINVQLVDLANTLASTQPTENKTNDELASGIQGQVLIGPTCPGPVSSDPTREAECSGKPYQTTITVLDQENQPVTTFETDSEGKFYITLKPGTYTLSTQSQPDQPLPRAKPQIVTVKAGEYTQVTITLDTGIR